MIEEGAKCTNEDCVGVYELVTPEGCSCHISPPCHACTDESLVCTECGEFPDWENYR